MEIKDLIAAKNDKFIKNEDGSITIEGSLSHDIDDEEEDFLDAIYRQFEDESLVEERFLNLPKCYHYHMFQVLIYEYLWNRIQAQTVNDDDDKDFYEMRADELSDMIYFILNEVVDKVERLTLITCLKDVVNDAKEAIDEAMKNKDKDIELYDRYYYEVKKLSNELIYEDVIERTVERILAEVKIGNDQLVEVSNVISDIVEFCTKYDIADNYTRRTILSAALNKFDHKLNEALLADIFNSGDLEDSTLTYFLGTSDEIAAEECIEEKLRNDYNNLRCSKIELSELDATLDSFCDRHLIDFIRFN